jgi:hypothetical protein
MGIKDVAGVFSRSFIVGFYLPAFFVLIVLAQGLTNSFLPEVYKDAQQGTQVLIVGGVALLLGLVLLGLEYPIFRLYEGYPLKHRRHVIAFGWLYRRLIRTRRKAFEQAEARLKSDETPDEEKARTAWWLDLNYPQPGSLMPTRFGNAVRAFEEHSLKRWGLDAIPAWPRVQLLLSAEQSEAHANAYSGPAFFVNGSLLSLVGGLVLVVDGAIHRPVAWYWAWAYVIAFALSYLLYRWAVGAAMRWGSVVRGAIDLHRLTLYEQLGVRRPKDFSDERRTVAPAVSGALLYGYRIPNELFESEATKEEAGDGKRARPTKD